MAEADLAAECGTTEDGTNYIGTIAEVLNRHVDLHMAEYVTVDLPNDPPTDAEVETFWNHLRESIDAGYGIVMNFIAPSNNPPFPIKGSGPCPTFYSYGVVYHYTSAAGYSDDGGERAVWVVDSGGAPFGYWLTCRQTAILCAGKGYAYARVKSAPGVPVLPGPAPAMGEAEALAFAMGNVLSNDRYGELLPAVRKMLQDADCTTPLRVAHLLAQVSVESGGLMYQCELADGWAYEGRQDLHGPNMQPGDGPKFRGHGWLQCTGRVNHEQVSQWAFSKGLVPTPDFFVNDPEALCTDQYSGMSVAWYFTVARPQLLSLCDADDVVAVTQAVNGGQTAIDERRAALGRCKQVAEILMPHPEPVAPPPAPEPAAPKVHTPLTGRPHHHGDHESLRIPEGHEDILDQLLDVRAEGLITQRLVFELAQRAGIDAAALYQETRDSF